jgi:hypothetical protein
MTNKQKSLFVLALLLLAVVFFVLWEGLDGVSQKGKNDARPVFVSSDWEDQFKTESTNPKGLHFFYRILEEHLNQPKSIIRIDHEKEFAKASKKPTTFVFVGEEIGIKKAEFQLVLNNVSEGGMLFISTRNCTDEIAKELFSYFSDGSVDWLNDYATCVPIRCANKVFAIFNREEVALVAQDWVVLEPAANWLPNARVFSSIHGFPNGLFVRHGKGTIFLHTTPESFFNYQLIEKEPYDYLTELLTLIPRDQDIKVLDFVQYDSEKVPMEVTESIPEQKSPEFSFLLLIFKNPYLRIAAILTLIAFLLILLFRIGRNQPYVPVLPEKRNRTREFAQTISALYMSKGRPGNVVELQYVNFMHAIQKHYYIDLSEKEDREVQLVRLQEKSGVNVDPVKNLLLTLEDLKNHNTSYKQLVELTRQIQHIYGVLGIYKQFRKKPSEGLRLDVPFDNLVSLGFLGGGFVLLCVGLYFLTVAASFGVVLFLIGLLLFIVGGWRYVHPEVVFTSEYVQLNRMLLPVFKLDWKHINLMEEPEKNTFIFDVKGRLIRMKLSSLKPSEGRFLSALISKWKEGNKTESNE